MPKPLRVLLVEDSEDDALLLVGALRRSGYDVLSDRVHDRESMTSALNEKTWDIILCDYSLPGFNAPAAMELLRESKAGLPLIIVSGTIGEDVAVEALKLGADDYLLKHNLKRLAPSIERSLQDAVNRRGRLAAEEARSQSENRLKLALEASTMGVWEWNLSTNFIFGSDACFQILGREQVVETIGDFMELIHPADAPSLRRVLRQAITDNSQFNAEFRIILPNGQERWIATLARAGYDQEGNPTRMLGTIQDITGRKMTEQAIRDRELQFRTIVETTLEGFWLIDSTGRFLEVNDAACRLVGYSREELLQMSIPDLEADEQPEEIAAQIREVVTRGSLQFERRHRRQDGRIINVEVSVSFLPAQGGRMFCFLRDISERKLAEQQLRRNEQQLRALSIKVEQLREAERTRIAREIHDELGQMLTGLKMDLYWLEQKITNLPPDPGTNKMLDRVVGARELADETIGTVQKIAADLRPSVLDKLGLATALNYEAKRFSERTGIQCAVSCKKQENQFAPEVSTALFRIFQEALTNVARHAQASVVAVDFQVNADSVSLVISDNGIGVSEKALKEGDCLGILGMKERAGALGGTLSIQAKPDGGTLVSVQMPLNTQQPKADYQL